MGRGKCLPVAVYVNRARHFDLALQCVYDGKPVSGNGVNRRGSVKEMKKKLPEALRKFQARVMEIRKREGCTLKEAMKKAKKK